ncbi:hypothetical protein BS17DRAFT_157288 [Gyrodon lividus]|nr:hypothetical protein BS17DRAFT_157288 [Gyrodon lividus]
MCASSSTPLHFPASLVVVFVLITFDRIFCRLESHSSDTVHYYSLIAKQKCFKSPNVNDEVHMHVWPPSFRAFTLIPFYPASVIGTVV